MFGSMFLVLWCFAIVIYGELACEDPASLLQRGDVHDKVNLTNMVDAQGANDIIDMEPVMQCLRLTTPNIQTLKYPPDAEKHFEQLHKVLAPWVEVTVKSYNGGSYCLQGYCGPWIENQWIKVFMSTWQNRSSGKDSTNRLAEVFGPYIPIFVPYNDLLHANDLEYEKMLSTLRKSLRPDVAYITISGHAAGLAGKRRPDSRISRSQFVKRLQIMKAIPNVLVLSPGGFGHVPIPHIKKPLSFLNESFFKSMAKRDLLVSFLGTYTTDLHQFRSRMKELVEKEAKTLGVKVDMHDRLEADAVWQQIAGNSRVSLCPRGWGRTSFHLYEILHLGLIPIHVYSDIPWLPYPDLYNKFGFSTHIEGLPELLQKINGMDLQELERMEKQIRSFKATHFTYEGVLNQISLFMKNGGSDLRCQKLPDTPKGFAFER